MRAANHTLVNLGRLQLFSAYFSLNLESRSVTKVLPLVVELERSNGSSLRGCLVSFFYTGDYGGSDLTSGESLRLLPERGLPGFRRLPLFSYFAGRGLNA